MNVLMIGDVMSGEARSGISMDLLMIGDGVSVEVS